MELGERHEETLKGFEVCDDCAMAIANGLNSVENVDSLDLAYIEQGLKRTSGGYWVLGCGENEENESAFSTRPCDCCRREWAGSRHGAAILDALVY